MDIAGDFIQFLLVNSAFIFQVIQVYTHKSLYYVANSLFHKQ